MHEPSHIPLSGSEQPGPVVVRKNGVTLKSIKADDIKLDQSIATIVDGRNVTLNDSTVRQVNGDTVSIANSPVGILHGSSLSTTDSALGICSAVDANINGHVGVMIGQSVALNNHRTALVITGETHGSQIQSILFLAGKNSAPVETLMDQRSVVLLGIAGGIALGLVLSLFRFIRR